MESELDVDVDILVCDAWQHWVWTADSFSAPLIGLCEGPTPLGA